MIAGALALLRTLSPRSWLILGALAGIIAIGLAIYFAGRGDERDAQDDRTAKAEARASVGRDTAATERTLDTTAIEARQAERDHAATAIPDSPPDDRELRRRCRQLRDSGQHPAACRGFEGPA